MSFQRMLAVLYSSACGTDAQGQAPAWRMRSASPWKLRAASSGCSEYASCRPLRSASAATCPSPDLQLFSKALNAVQHHL